MKTTFILTIAFYLVASTFCQDDAAETAAADDMQNQPGMQNYQDPYCLRVQCGTGMMCISVPDPMGGMGGVGGVGGIGGVGGTGGVGGIGGVGGSGVGVGVGVGIGGSGNIGGIGGRIPICVNIRTSCQQLTGSYTMGGFGGMGGMGGAMGGMGAMGGIGMGKRQMIPNQQQSPYLGVFVPSTCSSEIQCNQMIGGPSSSSFGLGLFACCPVYETYTNMGGYPGGMGRRQTFGQGRYVSRCIARPAYVATYSGFQGGIGMGMDEAQEGSA